MSEQGDDEKFNSQLKIGYKEPFDNKFTAP